MAIQRIVGQGVTHNRIFLRKCARWSSKACPERRYCGICNRRCALRDVGRTALFLSTPGDRRSAMTTNLGGEGQRVGCRACDVVFRDRTAESLALVPCPACGLQGEVI